MTNIKSSLSSLQSRAMDTDQVKRDGWISDGILVITPEDAQKLNHIEQQVIRNIGIKLYGRKLDGKA